MPYEILSLQLDQKNGPVTILEITPESRAARIIDLAALDA